jgi:hypothetical protein
LSGGGEEAVWPQVAVAVVLLGGYFCWQQNILEENRTERSFAQQVQKKLSAFSSERIGVFPDCNANVLFYLDGTEPVDILTNFDEFRRFMDQACPGAVITRQRYASELPAEIITYLQRQQSLQEQVYRWESKSSKKEKWIAWFWGSSSSMHANTKVIKGAANAQ